MFEAVVVSQRHLPCVGWWTQNGLPDFPMARAPEARLTILQETTCDALLRLTPAGGQGALYDASIHRPGSCLDVVANEIRRECWEGCRAG